MPSCVCCWLFTEYADFLLGCDLSSDPSQFYAQWKLQLTFCPLQTHYICSLVFYPFKEKAINQLGARGTGVHRETLDWIQFQLNSIFHLHPFLRLRITIGIFPQLPISPVLPPPLHLFLFFSCLQFNTNLM